jgi:hypothetical protein
MLMPIELTWSFAIDALGRAMTADPSVDVETVTPGEYVVRLPWAISSACGVEARVAEDAGFIAAVPGDDRGNKPNAIRVLTMRGNDFAPRPFTVVVSAA